MAEESSKFESAVSFLERAREVCPDVPLLLNSLQLVALDFDPTQPFDPSTVSFTVSLALFTGLDYLLT